MNRLDAMNDAHILRWDTPVGRLEVAVRNAGAEDAILLVAGQTEYARSLDRLAEYLSEEMATYQLELPGRGASGGSPNYANDVAAIIAASERLRERYEHVYGFGHSHAGTGGLHRAGEASWSGRFRYSRPAPARSRAEDSTSRGLPHG